MDIYLEEMMDHYKNPRNKGKMKKADLILADSNPLCGDELEISIKLEKDKETVKEIKFIGKGCAISQASMSILSENLTGKKLQQIIALKNEDLFELLGNIKLSVMRVKCALLGLKTVQKAIIKYETEK
ncbi:iron-sulfur cluster assembly scaffold protein [Candidatus Woesearchaeota archaeon]|nr:iron-sulfur cluster assembly scaffold protein [Candidatus Woesearchaeota archaeon]